MKKLLFGAVWLVGVAGTCFNVSAITLTNYSGKTESFWVQYVKDTPECGSGILTLRARGQRGRSTARIGNCPLVSINVGDHFKEDGFVAKIGEQVKDDKGVFTGEWRQATAWKGKHEIGFFSSGFFPKPPEITLLNGGEWYCDFEIKYRAGSACADGTVRSVPKNSTTRIFAGGACPLESITVHGNTLIIDKEWEDASCIKFQGGRWSRCTCPPGFGCR